MTISLVKFMQKINNTDIFNLQCPCKLNKSNDNIFKSKEKYAISKELKR